MIKVVCSVFDVKAAVYSNPFYSVNVAVATRDFTAGCLDPTSGLSRNPEDYSLFQIATFDDESGAFEFMTPVFIISAASAIAAASPIHSEG